MLTGIRHLHLLFAWIILVVLLISVILFAINMGKKRALTRGQNNLRLIAVIVSGIQLILGLVVYVLHNHHTGFGFLKNKEIRNWTLEHPLTMIIGIALIHIGSAVMKKKVVEKQQKAGLWFFGTALFLMLLKTPWDRMF
jgi:amino acid transporter